MAAKLKPNRMTDDEVIQFIRKVRFSNPDDRRRQLTPYTINALARIAKVQNSTIYNVLAGRQKINDRIRTAAQTLANL